MLKAFNVVFASLIDADGVCNKVNFDDKGLMVLCIFGLPYHRCVAAVES